MKSTFESLILQQICILKVRMSKKVCSNWDRQTDSEDHEEKGSTFFAKTPAQ